MSCSCALTGAARAKAIAPASAQALQADRASGAWSKLVWMVVSSDRSAAIPEQAEQEQVDEVQVQLKRAEHRLAAGERAVFHRIIHLLDPLRVPGGHAGEDQDAEHRDHEVKHR